jgi:hypothetical protein
MKPVESLAHLLAKSRRHLTAEIIDALDRAHETVVFGSSACCLRTPHSDLDLLCVSQRTFHYSSRIIDIVCLSEQDAHEGLWLGSELAGHVVRYGVWIDGESTWAESVRLSSDALLKKKRRIEAYAAALGQRWSNLDGLFRSKYILKLRRETQRLLLLQQGTPIPPTRLLDLEWWSNHDACTRVFSELSKFLRSQPQAFYKEFEEMTQVERQLGADNRRVPQ